MCGLVPWGVDTQVAWRKPSILPRHAVIPSTQPMSMGSELSQKIVDNVVMFAWTEEGAEEARVSGSKVTLPYNIYAENCFVCEARSPHLPRNHFGTPRHHELMVDLVRGIVLGWPSFE